MYTNGMASIEPSMTTATTHDRTATRTQRVPCQIAVLPELTRALWDIVKGLESSV